MDSWCTGYILTGEGAAEKAMQQLLSYLASCSNISLTKFVIDSTSPVMSIAFEVEGPEDAIWYFRSIGDETGGLFRNQWYNPRPEPPVWPLN